MSHILSARWPRVAVAACPVRAPLLREPERRLSALPKVTELVSGRTEPYIQKTE